MPCFPAEHLFLIAGLLYIFWSTVYFDNVLRETGETGKIGKAEPRRRGRMKNNMERRVHSVITRRDVSPAGSRFSSITKRYGGARATFLVFLAGDEEKRLRQGRKTSFYHVLTFPSALN